MRTTDTWVCVVDQTKARFFCYAGPGCDLDPMMTEDMAAYPPDGSDRFISRIVRRLDAATDAHRFDHLVLVATAGLLQSLHAALPPGPLAALSAELEYDLARATPRQVALQLGASVLH